MIRTLVAAPRDLERLLASLSVFESLAAAGRLVITLVDTEPASLLYATLLRHRLREHPDRVGVPLCLHRDALASGPRLASDRLRTLAFDDAVILSGAFLDGVRATAAGIPRRWGYGGFRPLTPLLKPAVKRPRRDDLPEHEAARPLLEAMDVPWTERRRLEITDGWRELGERRLRRAKIEGDDPVIGVFLGAGDGADWSRKAWETLLRGLRRRRPAARIVLLATDDELWTAVKLHEATGRIHPVIGPDLDLPGQAAVLHRLDRVVARRGAWMPALARAVGTAASEVVGKGRDEAEVESVAEAIAGEIPA